jgi:small-conductance mechanosensitive channel
MNSSTHAYHFINQVDLYDIGIFIAIIFIIALIVKTIRSLSDFASKKFPSKRMVVFGWVPVVNFIFYFVGIFSAFYIIFEPSREFLIGFVVSGFFAIGFALKDVVTSVIGGIVLLMDKPFQVGDRVSFKEYYGEILRIGLRSVKLLTLDESVVTIPNHRFLSDAVSSSSAGELGMMIAVDVHLSPNTDLYMVREILREESEKNHYIDPKGKAIIVAKELLGINGTVSFIMTVKCIIKDARLEKAFQTDFLLSVNKKFKASGVRS